LAEKTIEQAIETINLALKTIEVIETGSEWDYGTEELRGFW
jgi:hypothetical protein